MLADPSSTHTSSCCSKRVGEERVRKHRNNIKTPVATRRKTDSAKWKEATLKSLTYSEERIRSLCEAFLAGEITSEELRGELPPILNSRDREKRSLSA
jgi:hypothetical protein